MPTWSRLRAHTGPWTMVGLLGLAVVFAAAAAGPTTRHLQDEALRQLVGGAPMVTRDVTVFEPATGPDAAGSAAGMRDDAQALLPPALAEVVGGGWGAQRSTIERPTRSASLTGGGVATSQTGLMAMATLYHLTGLDAEVSMVTGAPPTTDAADRPEGTVIEVMAAARVAEGLNLEVGTVYHLLPGIAGVLPIPVDEVDGPTVAVRVTGIFQPRDADGAVWELDPLLLRVGERLWPIGDGVAPLLNTALVTDQAGIDNLFSRDLADVFGVENVGRIRLATSRLDTAWVAGAEDAVAKVIASPDLRPQMRVQTALIELLEDYERQAAAARAVASVAAAGVLGTGVGLLVLAARVAVDRRRGELSLLRARGGSLVAVVGRFLGEAVVVAVPAAAAGWLLHLPLPGRPDPEVLPGVGAAPLVVAVVALLAVPVTAAGAGWRRQVVAGRATEGRGELSRYRSAPVRVTVELVVLLLAGVGVLLLYQRGLPGASAQPDAGAGTDPFLAAVPVLIGLAAGLLALRLYPWPLRTAGALAAGRRGAVGFVGLARAGRAAPATALPVLVLVLAVSAGGFAGAVTASVDEARATAAVRAVGAQARFAAEGITEETAASVAGVPGVEVVAAASHQGFVRRGGGADLNIQVIALDTRAYQEILTEIGAPGRLPDPIVAAGPGADPLPVLTWAPVDAQAPLSVEVSGVEQPAVAVGDVRDLPDLGSDRPWVLVPRQALPEPAPPQELLLAGATADLDQVRDVIVAGTGTPAEAVTVTSIPKFREQLAGSGFNQALSTIFVIGTVGAALGGLLAVGLALVVQAAARGRALSLLRTMGLSAGQARGLLLVELLPVTALAVAIGAAAGVVMPVLLGPALGLTRITGGVPLPFRLDLGTVALLGGLLGVFVIGGALVEGAVNRRLGLGRVLRVE